MTWSVLASAAAAWLFACAAVLAIAFRRELADAWREPVLAAPVLIVESDDWGYGPLEQGLSDVQERSLDGLPTGRHIQMVRTPFFEKELIGEAFIMISGKTGYVLEMWGDPSSFMQNEGQFAEILKSFVPAGQPLAKLP